MLFEKRRVLSFLKEYFESDNYAKLKKLVEFDKEHYGMPWAKNQFCLDSHATLEYFKRAKLLGNRLHIIDKLEPPYIHIYLEYLRRYAPSFYFDFIKTTCLDISGKQLDATPDELLSPIYEQHGFFENCLGFFNVKSSERDFPTIAKKGVIIATGGGLDGLHSDIGNSYTHIYPIDRDVRDLQKFSNEEIEKIQGFDLVADGGIFSWTDKGKALFDKYLIYGAKEIHLLTTYEDRIQEYVDYYDAEVLKQGGMLNFLKFENPLYQRP